MAIATLNIFEAKNRGDFTILATPRRKKSVNTVRNFSSNEERFSSVSLPLGLDQYRIVLGDLNDTNF